MKEFKKKWYEIPPYRNDEDWDIYNEEGIIVAECVNRTICEVIVFRHNNRREMSQKVTGQIIMGNACEVYDIDGYLATFEDAEDAKRIFPNLEILNTS